MAGEKGVLIVAETDEKGLSPVSLELLTAGRHLASALGQGNELAAILVGKAVASLSQELVDHGADRVYLMEHPSLAEYHPESYARAVARVVEHAKPQVLILGQTPSGRDLPPRLAASLNTGVVMNCIELRPQPGGSLEVVCPVFGGDARAVYRFDDARPCIVTLQARTYDPAPRHPGRRGQVVKVDAGPSGEAVRTRVVDRVVAVGPKLEEATILVGGGKGLSKKENYRYIEELAGLLGGLPAASRAIVDEGWVTSAQQVGLTGKYVAPELYFAVGISGASQHMAGLSAARNIVAINNDANAPIFRYARYGVVTDCLEFLPVFIRKCREELGK